MDGAIVDKINANFEGNPTGEKTGIEPGLITKQTFRIPQVLSTDLYDPKGQEGLSGNG